MTPEIVACTDEAEFGVVAAHFLIKAIGESRDANVILPTGTTPAPVYAALRSHPPKARFTFVQLDEYLGLPAGDRRLFSGWLAREVLDPLNIERRVLFNSAADPGAESARMKDFLDANPIHLAVIGIGANGHVGFNEPGSAFSASVRTVELTPGTVAANAAYWDGQAVPTRAITLGIADLKRARRTILLARGEAKADILRRALAGGVTEDVPASYLQRQPNVTVIADVAALGLM